MIDETTTNQQKRDILFAFAYGISLTLKSQGDNINDAEIMNPILELMDSILKTPKQSLIKGDDSIENWDEFHELRNMEQFICFNYLKGVLSKIQNEKNE